MEICEPTSKTCAVSIALPQWYLTMHLPIVNELLYDIAVLHPLMLKEDQAFQVIRRTAIGQDYVGQLTNEWKIYQGQEIPQDWSSLEFMSMDPTPTEKFTTTGKSVRDAKLNRLTTLLWPTKASEELCFLTHDMLIVYILNMLLLGYFGSVKYYMG